MAEVQFSRSGGILYIYLFGEIDHHSAMRIKDGIDAQILADMPATAVMDFENVTFMDSSGIGLILARYKFAQNCGTSLYVQSVNSQTQRILALAGIKTINKITSGEM